MSIFDVRHQPRAQKTLQRALACGRLPHAYLFHGPDGVGKETLAVRLARVLLCERPVESRQAPHPELAGFEGAWRDGCGTCKDCRLLRSDTHPDLHRVYRDLRKHHPDSLVRQRVGLELNVDVIRHFLLDSVGSKPFRGRAKVFIVREADLLSPEAQNALLKTLEEPPPTTFLILISASLSDLFPTTRSRCQQVPFGPLPVEFVAARLAERCAGLSKEEARAYALLAEGSLGTALRLVEDGVAPYYKAVLEVLQSFERRSITQVSKRWLDDAKALGEAFRKRDAGISDSEAQRRGLRLLLSLVALGLDDRLRAAVTAGAHRAAAGGAARAVQAVAETERYLGQNVNVQLAIDALVIKLTRLMSAECPPRPTTAGLRHGG